MVFVLLSKHNWVSMGSAASISHELLLEESNRPYNHQLLTKESLAELRRSSFSTFANNNKSQSRPKVPTTIDEFPSHVASLLSRVGIDYEESDVDASSKLSSTTKLVSHIFECLGALQHLVRANQSLLPDGDEETQSVTDLGTKAVGKLVHEMISIYGLCGDTLRILLSACPDAATVEDSFGRLPIHASCESSQPWLGAIENLIASSPEALMRRDGGGRLPLHVVCEGRHVPDVNLVNLLLKANPDAASARRGVGRVPLHQIMFSDRIPMDTLKSLCSAYPEGVKTKDFYGRVPLHYACDVNKPSSDSSVVHHLLDLYPEGATVRDSHLLYPLTIAIDRDHEAVNLEVVRMLYNAFPAALSVPSLNNKLPLHIAVDRAVPSIPLIKLLLSWNPQAALLPCDHAKCAGGSSPLDLARSRKHFEVLRHLLGGLRSLDPDQLRELWELNWRARRIVFVILGIDETRQTNVSCMSLSGTNAADSPRRLSHLQLNFVHSVSNRWIDDGCVTLNPDRWFNPFPLLSKLFTSNETIFRYLVSFI